MNKKFDQISIIPYSDFFYISKEGEFDVDGLFESASKDLKLGFEYQMSFFQNGSNFHTFFTEFKNLKKKYCYAVPLIFKALVSENLIERENFCLVFFDEKSSFFCFYEKGNLTSLKPLPQSNLELLGAKNENQRLEFFQTLLTETRILELFKQKSELLITYSDRFNFGEFFKKQSLKPSLKLEDLFKDKPLENLAFLSIKNLGSQSNFVKNLDFNYKSLWKILAFFIASFLLTLGVLFLKDYPQYKQNQIILQSNENLQDQIQALNAKKQNLSKNLKDLNHSLENAQVLNKQNQALLESLAQFKPSKNRTSILLYLFQILNENHLKIASLSLENQSLKLGFDPLNFQKALMLFEISQNFKLIKSEENFIFLEAKQ